MKQFVALVGVVFLAACGVTTPVSAPAPLVVTHTVYVPYVWPEYLKTCETDPAPLMAPHIVATDPHAGSKVAKYTAALRLHDGQATAVADDCRNMLAAALAADTPPAVVIAK